MESKTNELHVIKGASDWREFRPFILPNGVTCLAVSDPQSKVTAASVCVDVGAASDPRELSGLAHFTEHMCFLGSEKYPGENEYKRYLSCHGGHSNASTSMHFTTYKFDVLAEHAERAFDIFSNFFVQPLFTMDGTTREVNAVDSENSKNISTDARRSLQILKALADPNHYYSKFTTGNKGTLGSGYTSAERSTNDADIPSSEKEKQAQVREALLAFHKRHYRPSNMVCVMVGPQSLDQLQEWITTRFGAIADHTTNEEEKSSPPTYDKAAMDLIDQAAKDAPIARYQNPLKSSTSELPFNPSFKPSLQNNQWPILLTTLPLRSMRKLILLFPLPSVQSIPNASPTTLLSHLLGHEGPHSPFALLQDKGWIQHLTSGPRLSSCDEALFQIKIGLTEEGEENWKEVAQVLFDHCRLIKDVASKALALARKRKGLLKPIDEQNDEQNDKTNVGYDEKGDEVKAFEDLRRIWKEIAMIRSIDFNQNSPGGAYYAAPNIAQAVMIYGVNQSLSAGYLLESVDGVGIDEVTSESTEPAHDMFLSLLERLVDFTNRLSPDNCIVERCSPSAWEEEVNRYGEADIGDDGSGDGEGIDKEITNEEKKETTMTKQFFGLKKEKWYGVEYCLSPVDVNTVKAWKQGGINAMRNASTSPSSFDTDGNRQTTTFLRLPGPNRYLPRTLDLCPDLPEEAKIGPRIEKEINSPELLLDGDNPQEICDSSTRDDIVLKGRLWHRLDDRYALPKSSFSILFRNASVKYVKKSNDDSVAQGHQQWEYDEKAALQSNMLMSMFSDAMSQETYDAHLAGASWSLSSNSEGLILRCGGYSDRLPDLALKVVKNFFLMTSSSDEKKNDDGNDQDKSLVSFLTEQYFLSAKDKLIRAYKSHLKSGRADAHATYYMNLLLSDSQDVDTSLEIIKSLTLDSLKSHHRNVLMNPDMKMDCLLIGNIGKREAVDFFLSALQILDMAESNNVGVSPLPHKPLGNLVGVSPGISKGAGLNKSLTESPSWVPGSFERRLDRGKDIELHFSSENLEEENGAVHIAFQSPTPGFKGEGLSTNESLKFSSAIHLLCHILKEPLFDELRTKQQIGYVVSSYSNTSFSARQQLACVDEISKKYLPSMTPNESIVINILSKKFSPSEVTSRVDEFLLGFRDTLKNMPLSEIEDHATSLSKQLEKPVQKLGIEASRHFGKIRRYGPEVLAGGGTAKNVPWNSIMTLANSIKSLNRSELLMVWDAVIASETRSRIVSCVYGKTFPLVDSEFNKKIVSVPFRVPFGGPAILKSVDDLLQRREMLKPYDTRYSFAGSTRSSIPYIFRKLSSQKLLSLVGVSLAGAGLLTMFWSKNFQKQSCGKREKT